MALKVARYIFRINMTFYKIIPIMTLTIVALKNIMQEWLVINQKVKV